MVKIFSKLLEIIFLFLLLTPFAKADVINQRRMFFVDQKYDLQKRTEIIATILLVSTHAYAYVEDSYWGSLDKSDQQLYLDYITKILSEFDTRIYPIETQTFGPEPNPGVDKDPRITILFTPLVENAGGYFNTSDCFARSNDNKTSNQREMFYLNIDLISDEKKMESFLAHEFQHLISFNQKELLRSVHDDVWLNETRSEYAVSLLGYNGVFKGSNIEKRLQTFLANSTDSLTEWKNLAADYGQIAIFGEYLTEHWSSDILADSLKSSSVGIPSINEALLKNSFSENFVSIFRNWMIANIVNNIRIQSKYGYLKAELQNFKILPSETINNINDNTVVTVSDSIKDWQAGWYDIFNFTLGQKSALKIAFSSPSLTSFQISLLTFKKDGTIENMIFEPNLSNKNIFINGIGTDVTRVVLMPLKKDKLSNFGAEENPVNLTFILTREDKIPEDEAGKNQILNLVLADYGLKEGDFIRAGGDIDVYIINDFGYKRLILNPQICLMYGHLGARGCFDAVKTVSPAIRDALKTSWYLANGETKDGRVYKLEQTSGDEALLRHVNISGNDFLNQGGDFNSIFFINSHEQVSYPAGPALSKIQ